MREVEKSSRREEILEKQKKYLFPSVITYYSRPLVLERGRGIRIPASIRIINAAVIFRAFVASYLRLSAFICACFGR